jgi:hypothetical protein
VGPEAQRLAGLLLGGWHLDLIPKALRTLRRAEIEEYVVGFASWKAYSDWRCGLSSRVLA